MTLSLMAAAGCMQTEDLARFARVEETRRIALLTYPAFERARESLMRAVDPGGVVVEGEKATAFVEAMKKVVQAEKPEESKPAFALIFFEEDRLDFRTLLLDQYLNFWPGFEYLNEPFKGIYCENGDDTKIYLLSLVFESPEYAAHLLSCLKSSEPDAGADPANAGGEREGE